MVQRLEKAGLEVSALLGDYQGGPWDLRAEVWIILARATAARGRMDSDVSNNSRRRNPRRHSRAGAGAIRVRAARRDRHRRLDLSM